MLIDFTKETFGIIIAILLLVGYLCRILWTIWGKPVIEENDYFGEDFNIDPIPKPDQPKDYEAGYIGLKRGKE